LKNDFLIRTIALVPSWSIHWYSSSA